MDKTIAVAFLKLFLDKKFNEWGRELGPELTGLDTKEAKLVLLDRVEEAFHLLLKERRAKLASQK